MLRNFYFKNQLIDKIAFYVIYLLIITRELEKFVRL